MLSSPVSNISVSLSLIQSILTTLVFHKGAPFYTSILESPSLCLWSSLTILISVACMLETFPYLNGLFELRPWMIKKHRFFVLFLATADTVACAMIERYSRQRVHRRLLKAQSKSRDAKMARRQNKATAADLEDQMLREKSQMSLKMIRVFVGIVCLMVFEAAVRRS